jgi:hypothetical protein
MIFSLYHSFYGAVARFSCGVKCAICGDTSHPTSDCTRKALDGVAAAGNVNGNGENQQKIDSEYLSFIAELDGKKATAMVKVEPNDANGVPCRDRKCLMLPFPMMPRR